jgi:anti-sigma factor RsiW
MDPFQNDERISAYLDGELTADEQGQFEERLAESAELRQLVEELRALRGSLDLLPRHRLEDDFAAQVLRRAEREVLTASGSPSSGTASYGTPSYGTAASDSAVDGRLTPSSLVADHSSQPKRRSWRPLIYAAATIATAVLIMVVNNQSRRDNREIAQVNSRDGAANTASERSLQKSGAADERKRSEDRAAGVNKPSAPFGGLKPGSAPAGGYGNEQMPAKQPEAVADQPSGNSKVVEGFGQRKNSTIDARGLQEGDKSAGGLSAPAVPGGMAGKGVQSGGGALTAGAYNPTDNYAANGAATNPADGKADPSTGRRLAAGRSEAAKDQAKIPPANAPAAAQGVMLQIADDQVKLSDEMLRQNAAAGRLVLAESAVGDSSTEAKFNELLAEHKITWEESRKEKDGEPLTVYSYLAVDNGAKAGRRGGASLADQTNHWNMELKQLAESDKVAGWRDRLETDKDGLGQKINAVYVEGTSEQVQGLIKDLQRDKTVFQTVSLGYFQTYPETAAYGFQAHAIANGKATDLGVPHGAAPTSQPSPRQPKSPAADRPASAPTKSAPVVGGGAKAGTVDTPLSPKLDDKNGGANAALSKKASAADGADEKPGIAEFRRTTPSEATPSPAARGAVPPPPAAVAAATPPPAPQSTVLKESITDRDGDEKKEQTAERELVATKSLKRADNDRELGRATSFAVRLHRFAIEPAGEAEKLAATENLQRRNDSPAEPATQNGGTAQGKGFGAPPAELGGIRLRGEAAPASPTAGTATRDPTDKLDVQKGVATNKTPDRGRARETDSKTDAHDAKSRAFYAQTESFDAGDVSTPAANRVRAIFLFRSAPEAAAGATPAAGPASQQPAAAPAKK